MSSGTRIIARAGSLVWLAGSFSLSLLAYERALIPQYAYIPTTTHLLKVLLSALFVGAYVPIVWSNSIQLLLSAIVLAGAPNATYWTAVHTARLKDPVWGPVVIHILVLAPLALAFVLPARIALSSKTFAWKSPVPLAVIATGYALFQYSQKLWSSQIVRLNAISESHLFLIPAIMFSLGSVLQLRGTSGKPQTNSKKKAAQTKDISSRKLQVQGIALVLVGAFWASCYSRLHNPVLQHPLAEPYVHPGYPLMIHSSVQSDTGLIVVGEALPPPKGADEDLYRLHSARYMRAAHSLLGGVWTHGRVQVIDDTPPLRDSKGRMLGDSVYSVFVLQEAARMVNSTKKVETGWNNALIIGLGAGVSATAFQRHGIPLSVVEIDPAVYEAARDYFGLADPGSDKVFLEDARGWAAKQDIAVSGGDLYDIVIHDCFSGGGVPQQLYTVEFWKDLRRSIHPDGVLVVNYVGNVVSQSSKMVLHTLEHVFGSCRVFHDVFGELEPEKYTTEFVNMVFFCSPSSTALTFRNAEQKDYLGSALRRHVLGSLHTREIDLSYVRDVDATDLLLTDDNNPLSKLQESQGYHHWTLMREVLPDVFWETY